jgi:hypothetical protein
VDPVKINGYTYNAMEIMPESDAVKPRAQKNPDSERTRVE